MKNRLIKVSSSWVKFFFLLLFNLLSFLFHPVPLQSLSSCSSSSFNVASATVIQARRWFVSLLHHPLPSTVILLTSLYIFLFHFSKNLQCNERETPQRQLHAPCSHHHRGHPPLSSELREHTNFGRNSLFRLGLASLLVIFEREIGDLRYRGCKP